MAKSDKHFNECGNPQLSSWAEQIARGDQSAFKSFFEAYFARMLSFAYSFTKNRLMAEEVVEEVFVKIWNGRQQLTQVENLEGYCFRAVHNQSLSAIKKHKQYQAHMVPYAEQAYEPIAPNLTDEALLTDELNRVVAQAIDQLPERCRLVFDLVKGEQLRYREAATRLGITEKTVERQIGIALKKIAEAIQQYQTASTKPGIAGPDTKQVTGAICLMLFFL